MKTSDEKKQKFLDMQSAPENYSDEQIEAMMDSIDTTPDVDAEWEKFKSLHLPEQEADRSVWFGKSAAAIAGFVLVGAVYAVTVIMGFAPNVFSVNSDTNVEDKPTASATTVTQIADDNHAELNVQFDNVALADILSDFATYYNIKVTYRNEDSRVVRLYFNWNKSLPIEENIASLNAFEKINIKCKGDTLIVE